MHSVTAILLITVSETLLGSQAVDLPPSAAPARRLNFSLPLARAAPRHSALSTDHVKLLYRTSACSFFYGLFDFIAATIM